MVCFIPTPTVAPDGCDWRAERPGHRAPCNPLTIRLARYFEQQRGLSDGASRWSRDRRGGRATGAAGRVDLRAHLTMGASTRENRVGCNHTQFLAAQLATMVAMALLPPTSDELRDDCTRPYFLWWCDATVGDLRDHLRAQDPDERAYWMGALLREANTRDVWLYVTPEAIRTLWPRLIRHLGCSRAMWAFLLGLEPRRWPPAEARSG